MTFSPGYLKAYKEGTLQKRREAAFARLTSCVLCPRKCRVNRLEGNMGICKTGVKARVASFAPHFGEESPLVGQNGSGTIFFSNCSLLCLFCQNFDISHEGQGDEISNEQLANMMLLLQKMGCHNINFVTPTHVVPQILAALETAIPLGLNIPLVYNSGGYDDVETLGLLDEIVDIYMPDFKFWDRDIAEKACHAPDYRQVAQKALVEMHRQVGNLEINKQGIATRGLLVRHLVLPRGLAGTREVMHFLATMVSKETYVNIMFQYQPLYRANEIPEMADRPTRQDFEAAISGAKTEGIHRLDRPEVPLFIR